MPLYKYKQVAKRLTEVRNWESFTFKSNCDGLKLFKGSIALGHNPSRVHFIYADSSEYNIMLTYYTDMALSATGDKNVSDLYVSKGSRALNATHIWCILTGSE